VGRFHEALAQPGLGAIAEVKRRSPSAGDLRPGAEPAVLARAFADAGAAAVSVLVDERFGGSTEDLQAARAATEVPLLAKGFFSTRAQLEEMRSAGADAALLLLRDLDDATAADLLGAARALGLDALVEAHDAGELDRAVALDADVVGINARDLSTFAVDRSAQLHLVARLQRTRLGLKARDMVVVAESGIESRAQGAAAEVAGADAILVGSALMRARDPAAKLTDLLARPLVKVCGLTREEDVAAAAEAGADLAGFVLAESPRSTPAPLQVPETILSVGVFVGGYEDVGTDLVQLYAEENGHRARDGVLLRDGAEVARVLDLPWLEEDSDHWRQASGVEGRVLLAGGLGPENVRAAIAAVHPWCVDASRSLESAPGVKDHARVRAYIRNSHHPTPRPVGRDPAEAAR
jgi:indole-3-glycerol phosphate synthase / phosphoribosylanthranilate isomerase